ncbi:MAG: O-antigen ligase family protein [Planctomycetota bacterium]|jgi:hypothetical protein
MQENTNNNQTTNLPLTSNALSLSKCGIEGVKNHPKLYFFIWASFIAMSLLPFFPRRYALTDIAAVFILVLGTLNFFYYKFSLLNNKLLRMTLLLFVISQFINTLFPSVFSLPETSDLAISASGLWKNLKALSLALACLLLLQDKNNLKSFLLILFLISFIIALWAPIDGYLRGFGQVLLDGTFKLRGTKGTGHRFARVIYFSSLGLWGIILCPGILKEEINKHLQKFGYALCIAAPLLLLRREIPEFKDAGWLPLSSSNVDIVAPACSKSFYLAFLALILIAMLFWHLFTKKPGSRKYLYIITFAVMFFNLILTGVRLQTFFFIALGAAGFILSKNLNKRIIISAVIFIIAGALVFITLVPSALHSSSLKARFQIWEKTTEIAKENPVFGLGNDKEFFPEVWKEKAVSAKINNSEDAIKLPEKVHHTHNLWLQLLVERGIFGTLFFHILWLATIYYFIIKIFKSPELKECSSYPLIAMAFSSLIFLGIDGLFNASLHGMGFSSICMITAAGLAATQIKPDSC